MIQILGKRPFPDKTDEMDRWLDKQREKKAQRANEPPESPPPGEGEIPIPVLIKKLDQTHL